jgi:para-nitrobenzyl esterase
MKKLFCLWMMMLVLWPLAAVAAPLRVDGGDIVGTREDGVSIYRGIPYAAPPVGKLRWQPPQPVVPWSGVRACTDFGPSCPQPASKLSTAGPTSEDCLYLNIWAPPGNPTNAPVMVWIHGGGFTIGSAANPIYDGKNFAKRGVVLVSINYRLGPFGFLAHPWLSAESADHVSGNYGLLDQIAALHWVQRNISKFGGDPNRVTIFGESAGAVSVTALMATPASKELFSSVIAESGSAEGVRRSLAQAEQDGAALAQRLGCNDLESLRAVTPDDLLKAARPAVGLGARGTKFEPVTDGKLFPQAPGEVWEQGRMHHVRLMVGTNADEGTLFAHSYPIFTRAQYEKAFARVFGDDAGTAEPIFGLRDGETPRHGVARFVTVFAFVAPARRMARDAAREHMPVYEYHFERPVPGVLGNVLGATHAAELPYVFGTLGERYGDSDRQLSDLMMADWVRFAQGQDPWERYRPDRDNYEVFADGASMKSGLLRDACDMADRMQAHLRELLDKT